jgi:hypothetical protein
VKNKKTRSRIVVLQFLVFHNIIAVINVTEKTGCLKQHIQLERFGKSGHIRDVLQDLPAIKSKSAELLDIGFTTFIRN